MREDRIIKFGATEAGLLLQKKAQCPPTHKIICTPQGFIEVEKTMWDRIWDRLNGRKHG